MNFYSNVQYMLLLRKVSGAMVLILSTILNTGVAKISCVWLGEAQFE